MSKELDSTSFQLLPAEAIPPAFLEDAIIGRPRPSGFAEKIANGFVDYGVARASLMQSISQGNI